MLINFVEAINDANHYTKPPTITIAGRGLKVNVIGQANAVGPTSIEGSFYS